MQRFSAAVLLFLFAAWSLGYAEKASPLPDSDRDGLSDALETALLLRFEPRLMIGAEDCSILPAQFLPSAADPTVLADNGTIYGQAFPVRMATGPVQNIELHFYFLWRTDCGRMGHALDTEHVSVLLQGGSEDVQAWKAVYWYAAAHEDTLCDASQMTRASAIGAETHGAEVWISNGKHASFLDEALCARGCGGDRCTGMKATVPAQVIDLGEIRAPMNGSTWVDSPRWPLKMKMERSDFTAARVNRLEGLPQTDVAWTNPSQRPTETMIRGGNAGIDGVLLGGRSSADALALSDRRTNTALVLANGDTDSALGTAASHAGNGISKSLRNVRHAVGIALGRTGKALGAK
jgi:hypothetical protein